jgi:hypothetical protein
VNNRTIAQTIVSELTARLLDLEALGSLVAAAHLDAAIDALCRDFDLHRENSTTD